MIFFFYKKIIMFFFCSSLIILAIISGTVESNYNHSSCPNIIRREQWGARPPKGLIQSVTPPTRYVSIYQTSTQPCFNVYECISRVRNIQSRDMDIRGYLWNDIPFSYLIGGDGNVYEGRGCRHAGGVASYTDDIALDIAFIGNFNHFPPCDKMLKTARRLLSCGKVLGSLTEDFRVLGERQLLYSNDNAYELYNSVQNWPEWNSMYWEK